MTWTKHCIIFPIIDVFTAFRLSPFHRLLLLSKPSFGDLWFVIHFLPLIMRARSIDFTYLQPLSRIWNSTFGLGELLSSWIHSDGRSLVCYWYQIWNGIPCSNCWRLHFPVYQYRSWGDTSWCGLFLHLGFSLQQYSSSLIVWVAYWCTRFKILLMIVPLKSCPTTCTCQNKWFQSESMSFSKMSNVLIVRFIWGLAIIVRVCVWSR